MGAGKKMTKTEDFLNGVILGTFALAFGWLVWLKKNIFFNGKTAFFKYWSLILISTEIIDTIIDTKLLAADHGLIYFLSYLMSLYLLPNSFILKLILLLTCHSSHSTGLLLAFLTVSLNSTRPK